jgi:hypothetical protein
VNSTVMHTSPFLRHICKIYGPDYVYSKNSASELYRPSDRRLLVPTFADRGCHMVSLTDLYGRILGFLDRNRYFFFQVAPQLYSWGWVDPVTNPLLLIKSNPDLWNCSQKLWPLDLWGGHVYSRFKNKSVRQIQKYNNNKIRKSNSKKSLDVSCMLLKNNNNSY